MICLLQTEFQMGAVTLRAGGSTAQTCEGSCGALKSFRVQSLGCFKDKLNKADVALVFQNKFRSPAPSD